MIIFQNFSSTRWVPLTLEDGTHTTPFKNKPIHAKCIKLLKTEKELKAKGRGSSEYRTDMNSGVRGMKWHDNKCVTLASNFSDVSMGKPVKRYDSKSKEFIEVPCPDMVNAYNLFMGGVDKNDMLVALYCSTMKPKKTTPKQTRHKMDKICVWMTLCNFVWIFMLSKVLLTS